MVLLSASCQTDIDSVGDRPADVVEEGDASPAPGEVSPAPVRDDGRVGDNAAAYLRREPATIAIEVDAVEGAEPSGDALTRLREVLGSVTHSQKRIELAPTESVGATADRYGRAELESFEAAHRDARSSESRATLYIMSVNGEFAGDPQALGVALSASAFAIFPDRIERAAGPLASPEALEQAVLVHELGHLLRLVNIGYQSPRSREDPEHPTHSRNRDSVMFWAVEADVVMQVLEGPPPDDFDSADRDDLELIKSGKLP